MLLILSRSMAALGVTLFGGMAEYTEYSNVLRVSMRFESVYMYILFFILGFKIFRIFRVLFENILCILCLCFYVSPVQIKYRMFCKFRVLVLPYIPYFRIFRVFRHSVPSFRQSTIPPNRVTPTRGSLVSFHLSTLNNSDLTDYKGYMGSRNKQVYFLIMYYHFSTLR